MELNLWLIKSEVGFVSIMAHNVSGLCEGRASRHESSNMAQCLIVVQMFNKPLMPCFCKTLVMGSTGINNEF